MSVSHSPAPQLDPSAEIARLKRRLAASQEEVQELTSRKVKKEPCVDIFLPCPSCILIYWLGQLLRWGVAYDALCLYMIPLTTYFRQLMTVVAMKTGNMTGGM